MALAARHCVHEAPRARELEVALALALPLYHFQQLLTHAALRTRRYIKTRRERRGAAGGHRLVAKIVLDARHAPASRPSRRPLAPPPRAASRLHTNYCNYRAPLCAPLAPVIGAPSLVELRVLNSV